MTSDSTLFMLSVKKNAERRPDSNEEGADSDAEYDGRQLPLMQDFIDYGESSALEEANDRRRVTYTPDGPSVRQ
jgi:hypothetical protein